MTLIIMTNKSETSADVKEFADKLITLANTEWTLCQIAVVQFKNNEAIKDASPLALEFLQASHVKTEPLIVSLASWQQDKDLQLIFFQSYFSQLVKIISTQIVINFFDECHLNLPWDNSEIESYSWYIDNMNYLFDSAHVISQIAVNEPTNILGSWPEDCYSINFKNTKEPSEVPESDTSS